MTYNSGQLVSNYICCARWLRTCRLRCTFWSDLMVFMLWGPVILGASVLTMPILLALCKLAGLNGIVAAYIYMAFPVMALIMIQTMLYGGHPFISTCVVSFSFMVCSGHHFSFRLLSLLHEYLSLSKVKRRRKKQVERNHQGGYQSSAPQWLGCLKRCLMWSAEQNLMLIGCCVYIRCLQSVDHQDIPVQSVTAATSWHIIGTALQSFLKTRSIYAIHTHSGERLALMCWAHRCNTTDTHRRCQTLCKVYTVNILSFH